MASNPCINYEVVIAPRETRHCEYSNDHGGVGVVRRNCVLKETEGRTEYFHPFALEVEKCMDDRGATV